MIPALLQHRLLGGSPPPGVVVNPPDWAGAYYEAAAYYISTTSTATLTFTLKSNGTFTVVETNQYGNATRASGNWHTAPAAGVGAAFEARYTVTSSIGTATETNGASSFTSLSADRSFVLQVTKPTFGVANAIRAVLAEIRPTAGSVAASGTFTAEASAEVG